MQEVITYIIIALAALAVLVKLGKTFTTKKPANGCSTGACSGCTVKGSCASPMDKSVQP